MNTLQNDYNTQRQPLLIAEYGRIVQDYINHIQSIADKQERTQWVHTLVNVMATLNPEIKLQLNYKEVLWGHIYQISGYELDVDSPYELKPADVKTRKPDEIGYQTSGIRFRFYGRNLQKMVDQVTLIEDARLRQDMVNLIASFMYNSCKIWNNENLSNEVIAEHLTILSKGKLQIEGSEITVSADASNFVQRRPFKSNNNFRKNNNNNKNNKNRGSGKNQRRF